MTEPRGKKIRPERIPMPEVSPSVRRSNFEDVNCGYTPDMARLEAERCLFCKKPLCIQGCPVGIDIPGFIRKIAQGDLAGSFTILKQANPLPAVCGRVCPQETQCEEKCVIERKGSPVAIGYLERFVGDWGIEQEAATEVTLQSASPGAAGTTCEPAGNENSRSRREGSLHAGRMKVAAEASDDEKGASVAASVAVIGSGPAGIACAQDLAREGIAVTVFEALHEAGGVLAYGIPPFRLPRKTVTSEIDALRRLGVKFEFNKLIGRIFTIEQLLKEKGFDAVFIGTGAGLPKFMGIPGEHLNGVMSANEFLTRVNLMRGYLGSDTPVGLGRAVVVIGAGNTALDAARTALRMGAEEVSIVYRRTEEESPARVEELRHAVGEGILFRWLSNPVRLVGNREGHVCQMECVRMQLGEPDESGRRAPHSIPGSEFSIAVDTVIYALGTVANPIIARSTPGLKTNRWGYIEVDPETQMTSLNGVFAGGDIVTGAATVILALGAGRRAAKGILSYLLKKEAEEREHIALLESARDR